MERNAVHGVLLRHAQVGAVTHARRNVGGKQTSVRSLVAARAVNLPVMRHVYTGRDEMDAHFVKGLLEQEGIEAVVAGENLEATWSTLPLSATSLPGVYVPDGEEERALMIVRDYQQVDAANAEAAVEDAPRPTWRCDNCGEAVEEQFTECWKCGHAKPVTAPVVDPADGPH